MATTIVAGVYGIRRRIGEHRRTATVSCATTLEGYNRGVFLDRVSEAESPTLVLDLRRLRFFDGAGLQALVSAVRRVHGRGGRVWLRCAPGPVIERLMQTGIDSLVPIEMVCTRPTARGTRRAGTGSFGRSPA